MGLLCRGRGSRVLVRVWHISSGKDDATGSWPNKLRCPIAIQFKANHCFGEFSTRLRFRVHGLESHCMVRVPLQSELSYSFCTNDNAALQM